MGITNDYLLEYKIETNESNPLGIIKTNEPILKNDWVSIGTFPKLYKVIQRIFYDYKTVLIVE